jgi:hypothetical protein
MARMIDIQPGVEPVPADLTVAVGDVLRLAASGGRVVTGACVELLGIYTEGVLGIDGQVMEPMGPPSTVVFRAAAPGHAELDVVVGDPFHGPETRRLRVRVEPGPQDR